MNLSRVPPHNLDAEASVLGAVLCDTDALDSVAEVMGVGDFYRESHRLIYVAMMGLREDAEPVDLVTLADRLRNSGQLDKIGGASFLAELADKVPSAAYAASYGKIVHDKAVLRSLLGVAQTIETRCFDDPDKMDLVLDEADMLLFAVANQRVQQGFVHVGDMVLETIKTVEQRYARKELVTGVATGFTDLDRITAGFQPGDLIIIGARPSMGKTAFVLNIAQHLAVAGDQGVGMFSLEMSREQLMFRLLCAEAGVDLALVRTGYLAETDMAPLAKAAGRLAESPMFIDDTAAATILEVRAKARRLKREHDVQMLIIDYLQLMSGTGSEENRVQEISEITRSLKALAKELHIPVVALSQLNRQVEMRADKRPIMSDIRESGSAEMDSDLILLLYRDEMYRPESSDAGIAEVIIAKQRNGPTGTIRLAFRAPVTRFENLFDDAEQTMQ